MQDRPRAKIAIFSMNSHLPPPIQPFPYGYFTSPLRPCRFAGKAGTLCRTGTISSRSDSSRPNRGPPQSPLIVPSATRPQNSGTSIRSRTRQTGPPNQSLRPIVLTPNAECPAEEDLFTICSLKKNPGTQRYCEQSLSLPSDKVPSRRLPARDQKGTPVQIRDYPRSCKLHEHPHTLFCHCPTGREGVRTERVRRPALSGKAPAFGI